MSKNPPKKPSGKPGGKPGQAGTQPKQPPIWLIILYGISLYWVFQTCMHPKDKPKVSIEDTLASIHQNAAILKDGTALSDYNQVLVPQIGDAESAVDELVKKDKLSAADGAAQKHLLDSELVDGAIVVADSLLRGAEQRVINNVLIPRKPFKDFSFDKYQSAYQLLDGDEKKFGDTDLWQRKYTVLDFDGHATQYSGAELHQIARDKLSAMNKNSPVIGIVPGYQVIDFLVHLTGGSQGFSYWFAALLLALVVRAVIWPLSQRQLMWGRQMSQLAPMLRELKEKNKDAQIYQKKQMELYREYGLNPLAGCWPMFVQLPLFLVVYQCMLHYRFEFQKGTFLWINASTSHAFHGFFDPAPNLGQKDSILIILYAITLVISTLLTPVNDPTQIKQQRTIGIGVALMIPVFMLTGTYPVPAAFVLYWTFTNVLATAQSLRAYYLLPAPPLVKVNTAVGGMVPTARKVGWFEKLQDQMAAQLEEKQRLTEEQARKIKQKDDEEEPPKSGGPTNGKPAGNPKPPSGGKQKPKRRTP